MPNPELSPGRQERLRRLQQDFEAAKGQLADLGFMLQGSVSERWVLCGKSICRCREDPDARHGPYYQWSGKRKGKTVSAYLSDAQAEIAAEWVGNNREMERIIRRLRSISLRVARLLKIPVK